MSTTTYTEVDRDLMIDDLSYQDARDYVLKFLTSEKKTTKALQEKELELLKWNERLAFSERAGNAEQVQQVKSHLHRLIQERDTLKAEKEALQRKTTILKEKLQAKPKDAEVVSSAKAERLLADFEQLVDVNEYKLNEAMKEQEAEDELAKLKAKLSNQ